MQIFNGLVRCFIFDDTRVHRVCTRDEKLVSKLENWVFVFVHDALCVWVIDPRYNIK